MPEKMSKTKSFLWGLLANAVGGILVMVLFYFLLLKKDGVRLNYYLLGCFIIQVVALVLLGGLLAFGFLGRAIV